MDRKTWLKTFVGLAVSNAPAIDYRRKLRIKIPALKHHISHLGKYRDELEALEKKEADDERLRKRQEAAAKARAELARRRAEDRKSAATREKGTSSSIAGTTPAATEDPEARWADDGGPAPADN